MPSRPTAARDRPLSAHTSTWMGWADTEAGRAARQVIQARWELAHSMSMAERAGWTDRPLYRRQAEMWSKKEAESLGRWARHGAPEAERLDRALAGGEAAIGELKAKRDRGLETLRYFRERS